MKRAVVTGATGFVGANLVRGLLRFGCEVHILVRQGHRSWRLDDIVQDIAVHNVELTDAARIQRMFNDVKPHWVFHLAAHGAYPDQTDVRQMVTTNVLGTIELLAAALAVGFEAFVSAGSSSEYGFKDHPPAESEPIQPNSDYAVTKAAATMYCSNVGRLSGANIVTLRLYSVYGPWEEPTRLVPALAMHGLAGHLPPLAAPSIGRDFVYIDDVVEAFILAAKNPNPEPGAVYNIGTGDMTSLESAVAIVRTILPMADEPRWGSMANRAWDTNVWVSNNRRARKVLGWTPRHTFPDGFRAFLQWLQNTPAAAGRYRAALRPDRD